MGPKTKEPAPKKGDKVQAKWSGSNIFYPATVTSVTAKKCEVKFEDGTVLSVYHGDTKPLAAKSESTKPKPGRPRTRSRSAGRKPRSRSRSPRRSAATKAQKKIVTDDNVKTNAVDTEKLINEIKEVAPKDVTLSSTYTTNSLSRKVIYSEYAEDEASTRAQLRSSARIAALQTVKPIGPEPLFHHRSRADETDKGDKVKYSDEESDEEEVEILTPVLKKFSYLTFTATVLKIIILPTAVLFFCLACTKKQCILFDVPQFYSKWQLFERDIRYPLLGCFTFHIILTLLAKIPLGKIVSGFPFGPKGITRTYRLNGFMILLVVIATFAGHTYYFKGDCNWGYDKIRPIVISSVLFSIFWALVLHFAGLYKKRSSSQEPELHNQQCGFLGNFYNGHEINPKLYFFNDMKTRFIYFGLIGLVLVDLSILAKFFFKENSVSVPLALTVGMQISFVLDYLWREDAMLSTATYTDDGVGYAFIMSIACVIPSAFALQNVYLFNYHAKASHLPHWCSAGIALIYIFGYLIFILSSNIKHKFRRNPFSSTLAYIDSIPTSKKKRLIISGLWGIIRHPNYMGLILMVTACSLPCGFSHSLPFIPLLLIISMLVLRSYNVERDCKAKYGPAWKNYTEKVRSRLVPYVF